MGSLMENNSSETVDLIERARAGDQRALSEIFARHRDRLRRMVEMRLDWRLQARMDASDVIQDALRNTRLSLRRPVSRSTINEFSWTANHSLVV